MGLGLRWDGTGLGRSFGSAAPELRARGHGHSATPSPHHSRPITLPVPHLATPSPCQPVTPSRLLPHEDVTCSQSSPGPRSRGSRWADPDVLPASPASPAPLPELPQAQLCRGASISLCPVGLGVLWAPCSITVPFRARWAAAATAQVLGQALVPHLLEPSPGWGDTSLRSPPTPCSLRARVAPLKHPLNH